MVRKGTIYKEIHNHGRRSGGSQEGNRTSMRRVRGAGVQRCYGYRWVAEISYHGKRHRCRSYDYGTVIAWLDQMRDRYSDPEPNPGDDKTNNGLVPLVGYNYKVDVANRAVYRNDGRPIKMVVNNSGSRYMLSRQDGTRTCISASRVMYAAKLGICPDIIPKDIYIIQEGDGYKLMYHKDMNVMNHKKARENHIRNYRNVLARQMFEMEILLNYYDTGDASPLVKYIMERQDELEADIYNYFRCSKQTVHDVVSETIEEVCQRATNHNLYMTSITRHLKYRASGKIRQRRKAVEFIDGKLHT